jgi:hypothetical protein
MFSYKSLEVGCVVQLLRIASKKVPLKKIVKVDSCFAIKKESRPRLAYNISAIVLFCD